MAEATRSYPDDIALSGPQKGELVDLLVKIFNDYKKLKYALSISEVGIALHTIAPSTEPIHHVMLAVVDKAQAEHWLRVLRDMAVKATDGRGPILATIDSLYRNPAAGGRTDPPPKTGRLLPLTFLYCHVRFAAAPTLDDQGTERRVDALQDRLIAFVSQASGRVPLQQNEGFLATFTSPSAAVEVALAMQRATEDISEEFGELAPVQIGYGLGLRVLPSGTVIGPLSPLVAVVKAIASLADHGQILMTAAVAETVAGASLGIARDRIAWANHGDFVVTSSGELRTLYEVADDRVREPKPPEAANAAHPGQGQLKFAGYELTERLTLTGSTVVYSARQMKEGAAEPVAIKVFLSQRGQDADLRARFLVTPHLLEKIDHPGIIRIREVRDEALPYLVMDWIDGEHLDVAMAEPELLEKDRLALAIKVCDAIAAAHANGILHGDLKPSNIMVRESDGQPVVLDFDQHDWVPTSLTDTTNQAAVGTPLYVAPELITGLLPGGTAANAADQAPPHLPPYDPQMTPASDIYSLGMLLYECFVGRPAFDLGNRQAVLDAHVNADPPLPRIENPDFNLDLEAVLLKAIEKYPAARYQTAAELRDDLEKVMRGEKVAARPNVYNNMMETRARSAMRNIDRWKNEKHITGEEHGRLRRAFDSLLRSGLSAVGESRLTHLHIVALYLSGALLVSGLAFFLLMSAQKPLTQELRIAVGIAIPVASVLAWLQARRVGRFRIAFAIAILSVSSLPLAIANTLYELTPESTFWSTSWSYHRDCAYLGNRDDNCLGPPAPEDPEASAEDDAEPQDMAEAVVKYPNWQTFVGLLTALIWARYVSIRSGTVTLATMSAILLTASYLVALDFIGWRYFYGRNVYHQLGFWLLPLAVIALIYPDVSRALGFSRGRRRKDDLPDPARERERRRLAIPFVNVGTFVLVVACTLIAFNWPGSLHPWLFPGGEDVDIEVMQCLMIAIAGVLFYVVADRVTKRVFPDAVAGYWLLYYTGIVYSIAGLLFADGSSTENVVWMPQWHPPIFSQQMTVAVPLALVLAVLIILDSARLNTRGVMTVGIGLLVTVLWYVQHVFFAKGDGQGWWAYLLIACGSVGLVAIFAVQLRPTQQPDIDDVGERLVREAEKKTGSE
jgi:serine/threonine protein kinase